MLGIQVSGSLNPKPLGFRVQGFRALGLQSLRFGLKWFRPVQRILGFQGFGFWGHP